MDRNTVISPLGVQRLRLLDCLGGNTPQAAGYFDTGDATNVFASFREYTARMCKTWGNEPDAMSQSLLATARLLCGEIEAADDILQRLPAVAPKRDHGAGYCAVLPQTALRACVPLPAELSDTSRWLAGSAEQAALRQWFNENRGRLKWNEQEGVYRIA